MMRRLLPLTAILTLALTGCGSSSGPGDRGTVAPTADRGKPVTPQDLESMPPEARRQVETHLRDASAQQAMADKMHGK